MVQEIITYIIVFLAFGITIYKALQSFQMIGKKKTAASACSACSSSACGSCSFNSISEKKPQFPIRVLYDEIKTH